MDNAVSSISLFFPLFKDERTVETVMRKGIDVLTEMGIPWEIVVVDDGSPDRAGEIAGRLARNHANIQVLRHERNLGYGAALRTGLTACRHEWIAMTDGDDEYDVGDLPRLCRVAHHYDLVITFRFKKLYSTWRIFVSWVYNRLLKMMFRTSFRDVSTGLRLARKDLLEELELESDSTFIGAEMAIRAMLEGHPVGEVGIQTFPRTFGKGSSTSLENILATLRDMWRIRRQVFSDYYDLPPGRKRG